MTGHALLPPSSAHIWVHCPGSVVMTSLVPETDKNREESEEGTAAHWVSELILDDCRENGAYITDGSHLLGTQAPNGVIVTEEMIEGANMYVSEIADVMGKVDFQNLMIEVQIQTDISEHCWGTPDAAGTLDLETMTLHVWDYKFGHGNVEAFENEQLICYVNGLTKLYGIADDTQVKVHIHVIQPRYFGPGGPIKEWGPFPLSDLRGYYNRFRAAAHAALSDEAECVSGSQCRYCPARHQCKSARIAAAEGFRYANLAEPEPLTEEALAYELDALEDAERAIKYRRDSLVEEAQSRISAGKKIPGYATEMGYGHRVFLGDSKQAQLDTAEAIGMMYEVDLRAPAEALSPAKAAETLQREAGLTKKEANDALEGFVSKPKRGVKLVRDKGTKASTTFSK